MRDLAPSPSDEFRALTLHDVVPAGHIAVPILRGDWAPHLCPGEFAIIDVSDTEPQMGELYGLMIGAAVMFRFNMPRLGRTPYIDGPLRRDAWFKKCRGRVVGVLSISNVEVPHV